MCAGTARHTSPRPSFLLSLDLPKKKRGPGTFSETSADRKASRNHSACFLENCAPQSLTRKTPIFHPKIQYAGQKRYQTKASPAYPISRGRKFRTVQFSAEQRNHPKVPGTAMRFDAIATKRSIPSASRTVLTNATLKREIAFFVMQFSPYFSKTLRRQVCRRRRDPRSSS